MGKWIVVAALTLLSPVAFAAPPWASSFTGQLNASAMKCKFAARLEAQAEINAMRLTRVTRRVEQPDAKYADQYVKACGESAKEGRDAFNAALPAAGDDAPHVKAVYAAWLTYMDAIDPGVDVDSTPAKTAYDQAMNEMFVEIDGQ